MYVECERSSIRFDDPLYHNRQANSCLPIVSRHTVKADESSARLEADRGLNMT